MEIGFNNTGCEVFAAPDPSNTSTLFKEEKNAKIISSCILKWLRSYGENMEKLWRLKNESTQILFIVKRIAWIQKESQSYLSI